MQGLQSLAKCDRFRACSLRSSPVQIRPPALAHQGGTATSTYLLKLIFGVESLQERLSLLIRPPALKRFYLTKTTFFHE